MQDSDKVEPVGAEQTTSNKDSAIAKRRKLIGRVLMGAPAVLLMTTKSLRAQSADAKNTMSAPGVSESLPTS